MIVALLGAAYSMAQVIPQPGPPTPIGCAFNSSPVTLADGQAGWTQCTADGKLQVNASVSASISGFPTVQTTGTPISVTTGGVTGTLPAGTVIVASNTGATNLAYCKLGASATTSDQPIQPGSWFAFTVGANSQLTCITSTSTTTVNMVGGSGLPTGAGGGGSSGGGGGGAITAASGSYAAGALSSGSIASGAMVDLGVIADAAATSGSTGTVSAKLRLMTTQLTTLNSTLNSPFQAGGSIGNTTFGATITAWGGSTLGAASNFGTTPGAVLVPGVNAFSFGATSNAGSGVATSANNTRGVSFGYLWNGTTWDQAAGDATNGAFVNVKTSVLPTGASTAAKQPALGTAGSASTDVLTVQGITSMTPFLTNPGTAANWGVGTSTQNSTTVANGHLGLAQFNTTPTTITSGNMSPLQLDNAGNLLVNIKAGAGSGGTALADEATFTQGTTSVTPIGCFFTSSVTNLTTGQAGVARCTNDRTQLVTVANANANGSATSANSSPVVIASDQAAVPVKGNAANGAAVSGNPNLVAGSDGTNARTIATDAVGNQKVISGASAYETVAASQTAQALGATGATGDYLSHCVVTPGTTSPGVVTILDNATTIVAFPGGASSVSNLVPFTIPMAAVSVSGAWKITTGANVTVVCVGRFT